MNNDDMAKQRFFLLSAIRLLSIAIIVVGLLALSGKIAMPRPAGAAIYNTPVPASPARTAGNCAGNASNPTIPAVTLDQRGIARSTPCTTGAFDLTSVFYNGFEG